MNQVRKHIEAIQQAEQFVNESLQHAVPDVHKPSYHASPRIHWMNDPNGLIQYRGEYHLYYQHNPYSEEWGNIHWAHKKSKDLIHWEELPIALAPSEWYDKDGCFSGSSIEHEGKLYVYYTSNVFTSPQGLPDDLLQQQCLAISEDGGISFTKYENNPIIEAPPAGIGQNNHFRDPKVWKHGDHWYMVLGTKKDDKGKVLLYRSHNLLEWEYVSVIAQSDGSMGYMYECPDLFRIGEYDILLISPEGVRDYPLSGYYVGKLDYETGTYTHGAFHVLDDGFHFYAPQTMEDHLGRRVLIGWMPMNGRKLGKSWSGAMTIPRVLTLDEHNERLIIQPVEELIKLRTQHIQHKQLIVDSSLEQALPKLQGRRAELKVAYNLTESDAQEFGISILASDQREEETVIRYSVSSNELTLDCSKSYNGSDRVKSITLGQASDQLILHLLIDHSVVEIYVNEGERVLSCFVFPKESSNHFHLFTSSGKAVIDSLDFWELDV